MIRYLIAPCALVLMPLVVFAGLALAQAQPPPQPTPEQQVLRQLAAEAWQEKASCMVQVLTLQAELAKAKSTPDAPKAPAPP